MLPWVRAITEVSWRCRGGPAGFAVPSRSGGCAELGCLGSNAWRFLIAEQRVGYAGWHVRRWGSSRGANLGT